MKIFQCSQATEWRTKAAHGETVGLGIHPNEAPERGGRKAMAVPVNVGSVCRDAGKSGGGPPQSKTLRAAWKILNHAKRLGVRQSSGALLREPRSKINSIGFMRSIFCRPGRGGKFFLGNEPTVSPWATFCRASGALAALVCFLAVGAAAETTNALSDAEIQGRQLAREICEALPTKNLTTTGVMKIRDGKGKTTEYPITITVSALHTDGWMNGYLISGTNSDSVSEKLAINHSIGVANWYRIGKTNPETAFHGCGQVVFTLHPTKNDSSLTMSPFANSDFWLADLGLEFFHWPAQKVLPKTTNLKRGREYTLLESTNPNPTTNGYSRVLSWIDKESGGILEAEAYDFSGKLLKDFAPKSFKKVNGQWELQEMEIRNVQTGSRTRLEFDLKQ